MFIKNYSPNTLYSWKTKTIYNSLKQVIDLQKKLSIYYTAYLAVSHVMDSISANQT